MNKNNKIQYKYEHIMLVDDNEVDNYINEKTIEMSFFSKNVYMSTSSKSALEFLHNLELTGDISSSIYPELIFIDINMPVIDGFRFLEQLLKLKNKNIKKCKLIILTTSVYPEDRKKANSLLHNITFLNKPLTVEMLKNI